MELKTWQFATHAICNMYNLQHAQFATLAICNTYNFQHIQFSTRAIWYTCNWQQVQFATLAIHNTCNSQHVQLATYATYLVSKVVPHLRGERIEYPVIPQVHWKGIALPWQRSPRILKNLSNFKGLYSLFSAVERFSYLRDSLNYFGLIDFFIKV